MTAIRGVVNQVAGGVRPASSGSAQGLTDTERKWIANAPPEMQATMRAQLQMQKMFEVAQMLSSGLGGLINQVAGGMRGAPGGSISSVVGQVAGGVRGAPGGSISSVVGQVAGGVRGAPGGSISSVVNQVTGGVRGLSEAESQWIASAPPEMQQQMKAQLELQKMFELVQMMSRW